MLTKDEYVTETEITVKLTEGPETVLSSHLLRVDPGEQPERTRC